MAGGKITRICNGSFVSEISGSYECYTDTFKINAGGKSKIGGEKGTKKGKPKKAKSDHKHIIRGWWSTDAAGNKPIREALLGDIVYFHVETENIADGDGIFMSLFDDDVHSAKEEQDGNKGSDRIVLNGKQDDFIKVKGNKVVRKIDLTNFSRWIEAEADKTIELFFICSYKNENVQLPVSFADYLLVKQEIKAGAFLFILTDELLPSGKLVRKVVVPPPHTIFDYLKSNKFEMLGMSSPNPLSNYTIGEHASGLNQSKYLSASSLPKGAPNISGAPQYIDIEKAKKAGCKIYSTEEIVLDLKRLKEKAPNVQAKARIDKVINAVSNIEKEVLIEGTIPANAIKSSTAIKITNGLRILNVIGIVITVYELNKATNKSIKENSIKPIAAESIRQIGGWGGAIAGAKIGAIGGAAVGIETGPGALIFGTAGYFGADWVADYIDEN